MERPWQAREIRARSVGGKGGFVPRSLENKFKRGCRANCRGLWIKTTNVYWVLAGRWAPGWAPRKLPTRGRRWMHAEQTQDNAPTTLEFGYSDSRCT